MNRKKIDGEKNNKSITTILLLDNVSMNFHVFSDGMRCKKNMTQWKIITTIAIEIPMVMQNRSTSHSFRKLQTFSHWHCQFDIVNDTRFQ